MERKRSALQGFTAAAGLLVLIFDSDLALDGARTGMDLCLKTVIPSLFPFFVLSMILTNSLSEQRSMPVHFLARMMGIPRSAAPLVIPAILGGYPVGAKCVGDLYRKNQISKAEAEKLLAFCSNAGPSFLFGMISGFFPGTKWVWLLWLTHIVSVVLTATVISVQDTNSQKSPLPEERNQNHILFSAAKAMGLVCCWVILFRTLLSFFNHWVLWMLPQWLQVLIIGILELTNGCCELSTISDVHLRFVLCACMLSFGGICVLFQTASVTNGLSLKYYARGKLLQTVFSFFLSCSIISDFSLMLFPLVAVLIVILRKKQNNYSNPNALPV